MKHNYDAFERSLNEEEFSEVCHAVKPGKTYYCLSSVITFIYLSEYSSRVIYNLSNFFQLDLNFFVVVGVIILGLILVLPLIVVIAFVSHKCIKGIEQRDFSKIKPMMILLAINAILTFPLIFFSLNAFDIIKSISRVVCACYVFIVIYSLHDKLRSQYEEGLRVRYNQHVTVVQGFAA